MKKIFHVCLVFLLCLSFAAACARQPTNKRTSDIIEGYFKKYSKKHPESIFGKYPVKNVTLLHIEEVHKNLIAAYAILELAGDIGVHARFTIQKKPLGWRALSWENMGIASKRPIE